MAEEAPRPAARAPGAGAGAAVEAIVGLGSNVDAEDNLRAAVAALRARERELTVRAVSSAWATAAVGPAGQPPFLNAAVKVETRLPPAALRSKVLRPIEEALGRVRTADRYAPRPIDLDLVTFGDGMHHIAGRQIPDPDLLRYAFLAVPAAEVAPDWVHPVTSETLRQIAGRLLAALPADERPQLLAVALGG